MGYCGAVPSENSSGKRTRPGGITKTGNAYLRRIVVETAWSYHRPPAIWARLRKRQQSASQEAKEIAWKAQHRLRKRYARLTATGKDKRKIVIADQMHEGCFFRATVIVDCRKRIGAPSMSERGCCDRAESKTSNKTKPKVSLRIRRYYRPSDEPRENGDFGKGDPKAAANVTFRELPRTGADQSTQRLFLVSNPRLGGVRKSQISKSRPPRHPIFDG